MTSGSHRRPVAILVSPVLPEPTGSGRALRAWSWLIELAQQHEVHVVVPQLDAAVDAGPVAVPGPLAATLWRCGTDFDVGRRLVKGAGLLFPPLAVASRRFALGWHYRTEAAFAAGLVATLHSRQVARIVVFRHYLADLGEALAEHFKAATLELDLDDLESQSRLSLAGAHLELAEYGDAAAMLASAAQYRLLEDRLPGRFAQVHVAAEIDRETLRRRRVLRVMCRPNRIALPRSPPAPPPPGDFRLLFVGTLNYAPNVQAVRRLLRNIIPRLRGRLPGSWRLVVVGRHASPTLAGELRDAAEVDFIEHADELSPLYDQAHVALVPLRAGGGTKLKTIEAFAHRRTVISTRQGVRGLAAVPDRDFVLAQTDDDFVTAIVALAGDRERAERLAHAGWTLCRDNYATA